MSMAANAVRRIVPERFRPIGYLTHLLRKRSDGRVMAGPFVGMRYIGDSCGSAYLPKLLGMYERELDHCVDEICARRPAVVVDIGAAEGYYAVGMAVRNPQTRVVAFETEPHGQRQLAEMARINGVADRVEVRGKCEPADLQEALATALAEPVTPEGKRTLAEPAAHGPGGPAVVCDVEGYEQALLDPVAVPVLRGASVLVELHDFIVPGVTEELLRRFESTHEIQHIWQQERRREDFPWSTVGTRLLPRRYLDWAVSEWRPERMAWLWMKPKASA